MFGHGGRALAPPPAATVGFGVGLAVGLGVGRGVAAGVGRAVGRGVRLGVGSAVGAAVGLAGVAGDATAGVAARPEVGLGPTTMPDGVADGAGVGGRPDGVTEGGGSEDGSPGGGDDVVPAVGVPPAVGVGVAMTAIWLGPPLAVARCCSSAPPIPSAIVARTIFRTPKLRMSRAR